MLSSGALSSLGLGGVLITLGYSAGRQTTIDVTDLIWKRARMAGFVSCKRSGNDRCPHRPELLKGNQHIWSDRNRM
jgi:hypothetical protein